MISIVRLIIIYLFLIYLFIRIWITRIIQKVLIFSFRFAQKMISAKMQNSFLLSYLFKKIIIY